MRRKVPPADWTLRLLLASGLVVVAALGLRPSFDGWFFLVFVGVGVGVSGLATLAGASYRLLFGETLALSLVLFAVGGTFLGGAPDPVVFVTGLTGAWSDLLTSSPPADLRPTLRVVPYAIGWLGGAISGELLRRDATPVAAAAGPLVALVVTLLVSLEDRTMAVLQGGVLAAGTILFGLIAQHFGSVAATHGGPGSSTSTSTNGAKLQAAAMGVVMLAGVALLAPLIGPRLPLADSRDRFDLRQFQDRPWNPLDEPSPLVTLKASLKDGQDDVEVFRLESEVELQRLSLATMSTYGGTVWTVADSATGSTPGGSASRFTPVDVRFPQGESAAGDSVTFRLETLDSSAPWIPLAGWPWQVQRLSAGDSGRLQFNRETGTVADPSGLQTGERFEIVSGQMPEVTLSELARLTVVSAGEQETDLGLIPPPLINVAGDVFEGEDRGTDHVVVLAESFSTAGFYDATEAARPGHSLARLSEFFADSDRLVGYEEQFAAGAAVLLRIDDISTRVVVGYEIPVDRYNDGEAVIVRGDLSAWIEVETVELGWVPIDVTPDRAREPEVETTGRSLQDVAVPNPPPPPAPLPETQPPDQPDPTEDDADESDDEANEPASARFLPERWVVLLSMSLIAPLLLLAVAGLVIVGLKRRRRRSRATSPDNRDSVGGAWRELCDRLTEVGIVPRITTTPHEVTSAALRALEDDQDVGPEIEVPLQRLAVAADRAAFHPAAPDDAAVAAAWNDYKTAAKCLSGSRPLTRRVLNNSDPVSLRRRHHHDRLAKEADRARQLRR